MQELAQRVQNSVLFLATKDRADQEKREASQRDRGHPLERPRDDGSSGRARRLPNRTMQRIAKARAIPDVSSRRSSTVTTLPRVALAIRPYANGFQLLRVFSRIANPSGLTDPMNSLRADPENQNNVPGGSTALLSRASTSDAASGVSNRQVEVLTGPAGYGSWISPSVWRVTSSITS